MMPWERYQRENPTRFALAVAVAFGVVVAAILFISDAGLRDSFFRGDLSEKDKMRILKTLEDAESLPLEEQREVFRVLAEEVNSKQNEAELVEHRRRFDEVSSLFRSSVEGDGQFEFSDEGKLQILRELER